MRPLRYSINVTLDGCCHHEAGLPPDEESMRYWTAELERADALLFGRVTYEMMQAAWRRPATGTWPDTGRRCSPASANASSSSSWIAMSSGRGRSPCDTGPCE
jgi:hypothetical protein